MYKIPIFSETVKIKKIIFIEPSINDPAWINRKMVPSLGPVILATILQQHGYTAYCYSETQTKLNWKDILTADIIGININTHNSTRGYELADYIRSQKMIPVIFGGIHASLAYEEAINHCDYLIRGEAEEALLLLIKALESETIPEFEGIVFRENSQIIKIGGLARSDNINTVPDRNLLKGFKWQARIYPFIWATVYASRGCPYNCNFCCIIKMYGKKQRTRSVESVITEIKNSLQFHRIPFLGTIPDLIWICDDNFAEDRIWAISILKEIIRQKIKVKLVLQARINIASDREMLRLMHKAGVFRLYIGIETLDDTALKFYQKESSLDKIKKSIKIIQKHRISVHGLFVFGDDFCKTGLHKKVIDFTLEQNLSGVLLQSLYLIPGTELFQRMDKQNRLITKDWSKYRGLVINYPKKIRPSQLQEEIILISKSIYSFKQLIKRLFSRFRFYDKLLYLGEFIYQFEERKQMRNHIHFLKEKEKSLYYLNDEFIENPEPDKEWILSENNSGH